jgi:hypothetical protein
MNESKTRFKMNSKDATHSLTGCGKTQIERIVPSLHHRKEGWLSNQEILRSIRWLRSRGGLQTEKKKENHLGCVDSVAARSFVDDAATPPCGDARRGLCGSI